MAERACLYDEDFVRWTEAQATRLRRAADAGSNLSLDWLNLAEEIESLGRSQRRELKSRLAILVEHLLKLQFSPAAEPHAGWIETVGRERWEVELLLEDSPSLRGEVESALAALAPRIARFVADSLARRDQLGPEGVPQIERACYTVDQLLGDWLPEAPGRG